MIIYNKKEMYNTSLLINYLTFTITAFEASDLSFLPTAFTL